MTQGRKPLPLTDRQRRLLADPSLTHAVKAQRLGVSVRHVGRLIAAQQEAE